MKEAVQIQPFNLIVRDATIQRFEYSFELSWKALQAAAKLFGVICNSPREAIQFGFKVNLILDSDAWFEAMKARNETSHVHNEDVARRVYDAASKFPEFRNREIRKNVKPLSRNLLRNPRIQKKSRHSWLIVK